MHAFEYAAPKSVDEAVGLLVQPGSRALAGGQSLIQAMKLRLTQADLLVDLRQIPGMDTISVTSGEIRLGAMSRHWAVARHPSVIELAPGLAFLAGQIGDRMVRTCGTVGGSLANADPAACYPAALLAMRGRVHTDRRSIDAEAFFLGLYETALEPGELVLSVSFAVPRRSGYYKFPHPATRFAMVGAFVAEYPDGVRVGITGARDRAFVDPGLSQALTRARTSSAIDRIVDGDDLLSDRFCPADYRAALVTVATRRAWDRAQAELAPTHGS